jgi:D-aminopeptidase
VGLLLAAAVAPAEEKPRARALGVPLQGTPGPLNAITDVRGVEVGHQTLIAGEGKLKVGTGPVRTGVTAVLPRGRASADPVFAGWFSLNGNGEMTGSKDWMRSAENAGPARPPAWPAPAASGWAARGGRCSSWSN